MDVTDPFKSRPAALAALPRVVRLYILNCFLGFVLAGVFTLGVLYFNVANIRHLVFAVDGGGLALLIFYVLNGIIFAGVQTGIVVFNMEYED